MNEPRLVIHPRLSRPAPVMPGESLTLMVDDSCPYRFSVCLRDAVDSVECRIEDRKPSGIAGLRDVKVRIPEGLAAGLYDVWLAAGDRRITHEPHCVWRRPDDQARMTFVHLTDLHIGNPKPEDRDRRIEILLDYVATEIKPDFIINTGDLVNRYIACDGVKHILAPDTVREQIRRARECLLKYRIPHFITPGNHDMAFPYIHRDWQRLMGGAWDGARDDYTFSHGALRFIALDRSVMYDGDHTPLPHHLSEARHRWLRNELDALEDGWSALLFCHYDYQRELSAYLQDYPVLKILYGHTAKSCLESGFEEFDGGLCPYVCQVYEWSLRGGLRMGEKLKLPELPPCAEMACHARENRLY